MAGLEWRIEDRAARFPASLRLPLLLERLSRANAGSGAGTHKVLARTYLELDRNDEAWAALAPALAEEPADETRLLAGLICRRLGRFAEALVHLESVSPGGAEEATRLVEQARCLTWLGRPDAALCLLEEGLRRVPGDPGLWTALTERAIALGDAPLLDRVLTELAPPIRYLACCDQARLFLAESRGDAATVDRMLSPELVREYQVVSPADPLLDAVLAEVLAVDDFVPDPSETTTYGGLQVTFGASRSRPAWELLRHKLRGQVNAYLNELRAAGLPFAAPGDAVRVDAWVVRLRDGGHQHAHIHATSWLSGVFYLAVPSDMIGSDPSQAGCLVLPRRRVVPAPGKLVVFPSYMRHSTVPFHSTQERICIAFDLKAIVPE